MSYRENVPELDFSGVHVACLCGDNGHGKSALLDAITWCLWGRARGQVQDDLVSYGAEEARVALEFLARGSRYRAVRMRRRAGGRRQQGSTVLELRAINDYGGDAQPISGNTVRETQAKIEQLVGMDYETFINSAFLLQGRADEFTNKTPAERKTVLASILGLEAYEGFQARARERVGEKRSEADRLAGGLAQMQAEMEGMGEPGKELEGVKRRLVGIGGQLDRSRKTAEELRARVAVFQGLERELEERQGQFRLVEQDMAQIGADIADIEARIKEHEALAARGEDIEAGVERLQRARNRFAELETARQRYEALREERNEQARIVEIEGTQLESEVRQLGHRVKEELGPAAAAEPLIVAELEEVRGELAGKSAVEENLAEMRSRAGGLATGIGEAQSLAARYESEGAQLREKLHLLNGADAEGAVCPLCLSPLGEDSCQRLAETYDREIREKRDLYRSNREYLQGLEGEKAGLEKELADREQAHVKEVNQLRERAAKAETRLQAAKEAGVERSRVEGRLRELAGRLEAGGFAEEARRRVAELEGEMRALGFDEESYREAYQLTEKLRPFDQLKARLDQALAQLPNEERARGQSVELLKRKGEELQGLQGQIGQARAAMEEKPEVEARLAEAAQAVVELEREQQAALAARGMLEGRVNRLEQLERDTEQGRGRLAQAQEEQGVYQELVNAFGRQGIQAMLIETMVPRLEEESNILLGRMTDNRMHVKLETQRERRSGSGEPIETLEINVSDELGSRSYEMYSGGEAFRVNLALRIALSRVLSQRTGAPLPTLFIDEGFGTQDASGRERILDVISAIEDDFDKIIVITHLDDLKDMFPVRIEVQKDANGSTFWLS